MNRFELSLLTVVAVFQAVGPSSDTQPRPRLADQVSQMLRKHSKSAGIIEYRNCSASESHFDVPDGADPVSSLRSLPPAAQLAVRVLPNDGTYLVQIGQLPVNSLADTMLPSLSLDSRNLDNATGILLSNKAVITKANQMHIRFYDRDLGFSAVDTDHVGQPNLRLQAATLAEDLNALAAQRPGTVWMLTQSECNDRIAASFAWVSR